ncbi:ethylene-responsive transcription factor ERF109-like [Aegilops tauschii subsp. strangulata]|uniref:ethylene-responsive transcription factor ERF109-like n=1 Tax=Aegilops tauschii subsp. strangulata TaxID=200361 RepID=UPI000989B4FD|nr:ethylene-responsive transcription factor ERF084-like [Aegilops tauschii subsp. strangulata]
MPPKKISRRKTGFLGVRKKPSENFSVEFQCDGHCNWVGTFDSVDKVARAYCIAVWHFGRPRHEMNSPEIWMDEKNEEKKRKKKPVILFAPSDCDEAAMASFTREDPEYFEDEHEFYWKHEAE